MNFGLKINFKVIKYSERNIFKDNYLVHSESLLFRKQNQGISKFSLSCSCK